MERKGYEYEYKRKQICLMMIMMKRCMMQRIGCLIKYVNRVQQLQYLMHRGGEAETHRFYRYLHTPTQQIGNSRGQIIPNKILLSDHSTLTPVYHRKNKKIPLFALKSSPKKVTNQGNIFTNRGIITSTASRLKQTGFHSKRQLQTSRKKTQSSLSLFNKLILTPFNFVRPKNMHNHHNSTSVLKDIKIEIQTSSKIKPRSAQRYKGRRPSAYHRTLQEWSRGGKAKEKEEPAQAFVGWQTSTLQCEWQLQ